MSARDRWHDAHNITVFYRRFFLAKIADIFIVHINIHEAAQFSVVRIAVFTQFAKFRRELAQSFADRFRRKFRGIALCGKDSERRWDDYFNWHFLSISLQKIVSLKLRRLAEYRSLRAKTPRDRRLDARTSYLAALPPPH